ncbi:MAG: hypothetical protein ACRC1P_03675 [Cellulosilyticaceae bacterium]
MKKILLNPLEKAKSDLAVLDYLAAKHLNPDKRNKFMGYIEVDSNKGTIYTQSMEVVIYNPFDYYTIILEELKKTCVKTITFDTNYEQMEYTNGILYIEQKDEKNQYRIKIHL